MHVTDLPAAGAAPRTADARGWTALHNACLAAAPAAPSCVSALVAAHLPHSADARAGGGGGTVGRKDLVCDGRDTASGSSGRDSGGGGGGLLDLQDCDGWAAIHVAARSPPPPTQLRPRSCT